MMLPAIRPMNYAAEDDFNGMPDGGSTAKEGVEPDRDRTRILIVDDQQLIADSLAEILRMEGFDALAVYNGWDALETMQRFQPAWLLSDVLMPKMNGVQLAITIRQQYPKVDILLFSGQAGISEILHDGHKRGYEFELIAKPVHPLKLVARLKSDSEC